MRHLADACALIAFLGEDDPRRIMAAGSAIMASGPVGVLPITLWEIARKVSLGKLPPLGTGLLSGILLQKGFRAGAAHLGGCGGRQ